MNRARLAVSAAAVFLAQGIVAGGLQAILADRIFARHAIFRPEGEEHLLVYFCSRIVFVILFCFIFARISRRSGAAAGLGYGALIWLFYSIPMTIGFWAFLAIPHGLALGWIAIGLAEQLAGGLAVGLIYRPPEYISRAA